MKTTDKQQCAYNVILIGKKTKLYIMDANLYKPKSI